MDATEKVLTNLMEAMHKHIAKGHGEKKVDTAKAIEKAAEAVEAVEEPKAKVEEKESPFTKFLKDSHYKTQDKRVSVQMYGKNKPKSNIKKK